MDGCSFVLRSRSVAKFCAAALALLVLLHAASQFVRFVYGREYQMGLEQAFYLGSERSVPNWFSSFLMLACAGALVSIGGGPFHGLINKPGYAWMVPGVAFAGAVALLYRPFLQRLPHRFAVLFVLSGAVFLIGEVGFEILGGWYSGLWGPQHPQFVLLSTCKETLKRAGTIMFLYSLLSYAEAELGPISIRVAAHDEQPNQVADSGRP